MTFDPQLAIAISSGIAVTGGALYLFYFHPRIMKGLENNVDALEKAYMQKYGVLPNGFETNPVTMSEWYNRRDALK